MVPFTSFLESSSRNSPSSISKNLFECYSRFFFSGGTTMVSFRSFSRNSRRYFWNYPEIPGSPLGVLSEIRLGFSISIPRFIRKFIWNFFLISYYNGRKSLKAHYINPSRTYLRKSMFLKDWGKFLYALKSKNISNKNWLNEKEMSFTMKTKQKKKQNLWKKKIR